MIINYLINLLYINMAVQTHKMIPFFGKNIQCKSSFQKGLILQVLRSISTTFKARTSSEVGDSNVSRDDKQTRLLRVAVIGEPNSGKSTLTNRLVGNQVSVVTNVPHTTRQRTLGVYTEGAVSLFVVVWQNSLV